MTIVIIDYGSGNLCSAEKAFQHVAGARPVEVTSDPETVAKADHIVLPGVGAFGDCAAGLRAIAGMEAALNQRVRDEGRPFLGICVGMQLMCSRGLERGDHEGLGWIAGEVIEINPPDRLKVPHMGWNTVDISNRDILFDGLTGNDFYFAHSYAARPTDNKNIAATTDYGAPLVAILACDNMVGTQFHPEKSQQAGLRLIANFVNWTP